ncbi:MAG: RsiV family protein [Bdellovibrionaceae bacterium]|nr:RsiV family protein [Pseudobdellovibrionaceae bacterium]
MRSSVSPLVFFLVLLVLVACTTSPKDAGRGIASVESAPLPSVPYVFAGQVGKYPATFAVTRTGEKIEGFYFYRENVGSLRLDGFVRDDGQLTMQERDEKGKVTGYFKGTFSADEIVGQWTNPRSRDVLFFQATNQLMQASAHLDPMNFRGSLGARLRISGQIASKGELVSGKYRYSTSTSDLKLAGRVREDGRLELTEFDHRGVATGRWLALRAGQSRLFGIWNRPDGQGPVHPFEVYLEANLPMEGELGRPSTGPGSTMAFKLIDHQKTYPTCEETWKYPEIEGIDSSVTKRLNASFEKTASVEGECAKLEQEDLEGAGNLKGSFDSILDIRLILPHHLIAAHRVWAYTGGAHGSGGGACTVHDLRTGDEIDLTQYLKPGHERLLRDFIYKQVWHGVGASRAEANVWTQKTVATKDQICPNGRGLTFEFSAYEVGPYAMGTPVVSVSSREWRSFFVDNETTRAVFATP